MELEYHKRFKPEKQIYLCKICGELLYSYTTPKDGGCKKKNLHEWHYLGNEGGTEFKCEKCKVLVKSILVPRGTGCPNDITHEWKKIKSK